MTKQIDIPHQDGDPEFDEDCPQINVGIAEDGFIWFRFSEGYIYSINRAGLAMSPKEFEFAMKWYMENKEKPEWAKDDDKKSEGGYITRILPNERPSGQES